MRIDELPYHSSLFYKLNFVSRRQFFINIGKYPSKMQKVRNDPFLGSKIEKVPRGIRGEKSSKDMASSRNLVSTIGALASPKMGDGTRCPEG